MLTFIGDCEAMLETSKGCKIVVRGYLTRNTTSVKGAMKKPNHTEADYRTEADRLRLLTRETQRELVTMHLHLSRNRKLSAQERKQARQRYQALSRLLRL